jgi:hypothetical protein
MGYNVPQLQTFPTLHSTANVNNQQMSGLPRANETINKSCGGDVLAI